MLDRFIRPSISNKSKKTSAVTALFLGAVFLLVACGSSDEAATSAAKDVQIPLSSPSTVAVQEQPTATTLLLATKSAVADADRKVGHEVGDLAPEFGGIAAWINSGPLTMEGLRGNVVLVDFWTYTCINCINTFPFLKQMHAEYADDGLVIVDVHSPEFEFEKIYDNVVDAAQKDALVWPIAQDNDFTTWNRYSNRYWPMEYLIDKDGVIRYTHIGEGAYAETEDIIRELLAES